MRVTKENIFQMKQRLKQEIDQYEQQLTVLNQKLSTFEKIPELADAILDYNTLTGEIEARTHLFQLFTSPPESLRHPLVKAIFFSYIESAETVGVDVVDFLVNDFLQQIRLDIQNGEDDDVDLIQSEYKEYIIPGKIIAEQFNEIEDLLDEMNRFCKVIHPKYNTMQAREVLVYAVTRSIASDTRMEPTIHYVREVPSQYLTSEDRVTLLDTIEEHLAILRFEKTKQQNVAMDTAVEMLAQRQSDPQ